MPFYWPSRSPKAGGHPPTELKQRIEASFDSVDGVRTELARTAVSQFGSGWAWLVPDGGTINALGTASAEVPLTRAMRPRLEIDVWQHACYLDHQNRRADYVQSVVDKLINRQFVLQNAGR